MADKPIYWVGSSKEEICNFPEEARRRSGYELRAVQRGEHPSDFKPMPLVGQGVEEIRIRTEDAYRIFYVARFEEAVYVLYHVRLYRHRARGGFINTIPLRSNVSG